MWDAEAITPPGSEALGVVVVTAVLPSSEVMYVMCLCITSFPSGAPVFPNSRVVVTSKVQDLQNAAQER